MTMEAVRTSEMSVDFYENTRRKNTEDILAAIRTWNLI